MKWTKNLLNTKTEAATRKRTTATKEATVQKRKQQAEKGQFKNSFHQDEIDCDKKNNNHHAAKEKYDSTQTEETTTKAAKTRTVPYQN